MNKNIKINFMVTEEMAQDLKRMTDKYDITISKLIRTMIKKFSESLYGKG